MYPTGVTLHIRHLLLEGSSQWVTRRNVTSKSNIPLLDGRSIELPGPVNTRVVQPLIEPNYHLYLPFSLFACSANAIRISPSLQAMEVSTRSSTGCCPATISITDRVHGHICRYACFSGMRLLLQRNNLWCEGASAYLSTINALLAMLHETRRHRARSRFQTCLDSSTSPYALTTCSYRANENFTPCMRPRGTLPD